MRNNIIKLISFMFLTLTVGCADEMLPAYMIDTPRVLALQIDDPEVAPGKNTNLSAKLLVAGKNVDQNKPYPVFYLVGENFPENMDKMTEADIAAMAEKNVAFSFNSIYTEPFEFPFTEQEFNKISEARRNFYNKNGWFNLPAFAGTEIDGNVYIATKTIRVTKTPLHKNPKIKNILYRLDGFQYFSSIVKKGEVVDVWCDAGEHSSDIALSAVTENIELTGNDKQIYRWFVTLSKTTENKLYANYDKDKMAAYFGKDIEASERDASVLFKLEEGVYDVFVVVRDKSSSSDEQSEDRVGQEFFNFTLSLKCD